MSQVNWAVELRNIERQFSGLPPEPSPEAQRAKRAAEQRERERKNQQSVAFGAWIRLGFVAALAIGLQSWPYPRACGPWLFGYTAAGMLIVAGGLWVAAWTWRGRMARAHGLAMTIVLWGLIVLAAVVLPRTGYLRSDAPASPRPGWLCNG